MTVRAKFRCMSVSRTYEGQTSASFLPAMPQKGADGTPEHEENKLFWKYTPGGSMELTFWGDAPHVVPGAYYYIDLDTPVPDELRPWRLVLRTEHMNNEQLDVDLCADWMLKSDAGPEGLRTGSLKMMISNEAAWPLFMNAKRGQRWSVLVTRAG